MPELLPLAGGGFALVDEEDVEMLSGYRWRIQYRYHKGAKVRPAAVVSGTRDSTVLMHRLVLKAPDGVFVDHVNGMALNNTKANLRLCSMPENMRNRRRAAHNKAGIKGIYLVADAPKNSPRWRASITCNGVTHNLGTYKSKAAAAAAYRQAAPKFHGEFARVA